MDWEAEGLLEGGAAEIVFAFALYRSWRLPTAILAGGAAGAAAALLDIVFYYEAWSGAWQIVYTAVLVATPETLNFNGVVHGAAIATLVDHAGGYGAQQLLGRRGVTSDLHIRYLSAGRAGSTLTAESRVVRAGRSQIVMEVRITDERDRLIAVADLALAVVGESPSDS